ncbi:MAG: NUDIX hydrolase [Solirubrobacteraceae bacterium]
MSTDQQSGSADFSAGGVVIRGDEVAVIVPVKRAADGSRVLGLPKGHPDGDETPAQAATREVAEESGVVAELVDELGEVAYRVQRRDGPADKVVRYYRFRYVSGDVSDHDHEIEEARWMPLTQAAEELTYPGEREMVKRALSRMAPDR